MELSVIIRQLYSWLVAVNSEALILNVRPGFFVSHERLLRFEETENNYESSGLLSRVQNTLVVCHQILLKVVHCRKNTLGFGEETEQT